MCSIFGWIPTEKYRNATDVHETAKKLAGVMHSRGPDDMGWVIYNKQEILGDEKKEALGICNIMIGQNRLSIIDLSKAGHQPMRSNDGRYILVYNGEIYNYLEIRIELEALGYIFKSQSDTEVVLYAYIAWGQDCLNRFVGMFAFALYDSKIEKLFCARDFFGVKPFYFHIGTNGFSFASELPALFEIEDTERRINPKKAYDYLKYGITDSGNETMLANIFQLQPAHCFTVDANTGEISDIHRYWEIDLSKKSSISFQDATMKLRELFLESVRKHLRSDVPLGIALSGGIDSSSVACAIRYLFPEIPIHTFSYIAQDSAELSEEKWIDIVNTHIGAIQHKVYVNKSDLFPDLDHLIRRLGEPFINTSIYAQFCVFRLIHDSGVVVALDGQGADEMLAGYEGYPVERMESLIKSGKIAQAIQFFNNTTKWPDRSKQSIILGIIKCFIPKKVKNIGHQLLKKCLNDRWLNKRYFMEKNVKLYDCSFSSIYKNKDYVRTALAAALTEHGLPRLLRHGDRNAMTWSVESRVPFCTKEMTEFLLSLPEEYLISHSGETKSILRAAMRGIVPDNILDRKDKIGFQTPETKWFPLLDSVVAPILISGTKSKVLNLKEIIKEWDSVVEKKTTFSNLLWRQINYLYWIKTFQIAE